MLICHWGWETTVSSVYHVAEASSFKLEQQTELQKLNYSFASKINATHHASNYFFFFLRERERERENTQVGKRGRGTEEEKRILSRLHVQCRAQWES